MAEKLNWRQKYFGWGGIKVNRRYKDRLFRFLFREKKDLLELYNALNDSSYDDPEALEIVTLEDAVFMKMKNDLSFVIADRLQLYEHQSTYSPNMPLRGMLYFARQYEGIAAARGDNLYGTRLIKLPTPQYVVFYNGTKEMPDSREFYLSDSFEKGRGSGCLECRCRMININRGHNKEILERCRRLWEYSEFVGQVGDNLKKGCSVKDAVMLAAEDCIQRDILKDILVKNREEVLHMLLTEYNEEKHMRDTYREGREDGWEEGRKEGLDIGRREGLKDGRADILEKLVQAKLVKGKSIEIIAEELEQTEEEIRRIVEKLHW